MVRDVNNSTKSNDGKISVHDTYVLLGKSIFRNQSFFADGRCGHFDNMCVHVVYTSVHLHIYTNM